MKTLTLFSGAAAAGVLALSLPALAVDVERTDIPVTMDLAEVQSGAYVMDASHTSVTFTISHMGFTNYTGRFNEFTGSLNFDAENPAASTLEVSIPTASIDVNHDELSPKLADAENLNAAAYPAITFTATGIEVTGDNTGKVTGDLSFLGQSQPVTLDVTFNGKGVHPFARRDVLGFTATGSINRSAWGYTNYAQAVGDKIDIVIQTEFQKAP